ncbi:MAG: ExbD/TolR family protein [Candidatus Binatia bacterium]
MIENGALESGALRPRRRTARAVPDINVTPLVDVVLVLLIIFMVVAPHMNQDIAVNLPGIFNPDPDVEGQRAPETVTVIAGGVLYIQGQRFELDAGMQKLAELHAAEPLKRLALRADAALPYREVREVFMRVREIGFPGLSLMVGHKAGSQPGVEPSGAPAPPPA